MLGVWRLQLLREVSRRGSIKAAAEAMSITPSAVSQQLAILEREAGVQLLEKSGRRVRCLRVQPPPGDLNPRDKFLEAEVEIVDRKNHVLLLAGGWMGIGNFIMYRLVNFKI